MDNKKHFVLIMVIALLLSATIAAGCTGNSGNDPGQSPTAGATTNQQQEETPDNQVPESVTTAPGQKFSDPVKLPGSITESTAIRPKYDSETEEKIIDEAKSEILRVFPGADPSSLNRYGWDTKLAGSFFVPVITFVNVIPDTKEPENILGEVAYDPDKGRIVTWYYTYDSPINNKNGDEIISHESVDIERDIVPVFRKMIGDEEYGKNRDNYSIYLVDSVNFPLTTCAYIHESYNGVRSDMGYTQIYFNRANGEITTYGDVFNKKEFLNESTTSSPVPEISLEEAESILEAKINELYSDDPQEIEYCEYHSGAAAVGLTNGLFWLDRSIYMDIEDDQLLSPISLGWRITFKTKESRSMGGPLNGARYTYIDAHTGEIVYLRNDRIDIIRNDNQY
ncbi:hypothetical protein [Methanolacinia paynteri]|uniref:hypothetical protein n=1 Tax=Methanolacinia paynteri TaxID=230356 RepID=UPI0012F66B97|nr:hypothetical protein [Methanolacinia paynteri]